VRGLEDRLQRLDYLSRRLTHPGERIQMQLAELGHLARRFVRCMRHELDSDAWRTRDLGQRLVAAAPDLTQFAAANADLARRLRHAGQRRLEIAAVAVSAAGAHLKHLSPQHVLDRGYSITETAAGAIVRDGSKLAPGEEVRLIFAKGWAGAEVKRRGNRED
jgi:exodeoxyribonuclease VII large subunit